MLHSNGLSGSIKAPEVIKKTTVKDPGRFLQRPTSFKSKSWNFVEDYTRGWVVDGNMKKDTYLRAGELSNAKIAKKPRSARLEPGNWQMVRSPDAPVALPPRDKFNLLDTYTRRVQLNNVYPDGTNKQGIVADLENATKQNEALQSISNDFVAALRNLAAGMPAVGAVGGPTPAGAVASPSTPTVSVPGSLFASGSATPASGGLASAVGAKLGPLSAPISIDSSNFNNVALRAADFNSMAPDTNLVQSIANAFSGISQPLDAGDVERLLGSSDGQSALLEQLERVVNGNSVDLAAIYALLGKSVGSSGSGPARPISKDDEKQLVDDMEAFAANSSAGGSVSAELQALFVDNGYSLDEKDIAALIKDSAGLEYLKEILSDLANGRAPDTSKIEKRLKDLGAGVITPVKPSGSSLLSGLVSGAVSGASMLFGGSKGKPATPPKTPSPKTPTPPRAKPAAVSSVPKHVASSLIDFRLQSGKSTVSSSEYNKANQSNIDDLTEFYKMTFDPHAWDSIRAEKDTMKQIASLMAARTTAKKTFEKPPNTKSEELLMWQRMKLVYREINKTSKVPTAERLKEIEAMSKEEVKKLWSENKTPAKPRKGSA